ncbi:MAG: 2-phospho-L-lactate guanylyltransferase [Microbacteriaceae bacterium]
MTDSPGGPAAARGSAHRRIEEQAVGRLGAVPRDTAVIRTGRRVEGAHEPEPTREWIVVVPVKGTAAAKSRLGLDGGRPDGGRPGDARPAEARPAEARPTEVAALARAMALDTVDAAARAAGVAGVLVVTSPEAAADFDAVDALVLVEDRPAGLASAIGLGLETAAAMGAPGRGTAVLLGDLPALRPEELAAALEAARAHERAFVPDAAGTGTTLVTAADGAAHRTAFGPGSAAAHTAAGYRVLDVAAGSGLRQDVDTAADLVRLGGRLGPRSRAALASG